MNLPCAVCIDTGGSFASEASSSALIAQILGVNSLPDPPAQTLVDEKIKAYELSLETKYYTTKVWLCNLSEKTIGNQAFSELAEVAILTFDGSWLGELDSWLPFLEQWELHVRVLVCNRVAADPLLKKQVVEWCRDHSFELVELEPSDESREEATECGEVTGIPRIRQILKAHPWTNLELKDEETSAERIERLRTYLNSIGDSDEVCPNEEETSISTDNAGLDDSTIRELASRLAEKTPNGTDDVKDTVSSSAKSIPGPASEEEQIFRAVDSGDDPGEISFEEMFSKFASMKEEANNLPPEARRDYAEKVTMAFWKAIGGDEEELDGLDSIGD